MGLQRPSRTGVGMKPVSFFCFDSAKRSATLENQRSIKLDRAMRPSVRTLTSVQSWATFVTTEDGMVFLKLSMQTKMESRTSVKLVRSSLTSLQTVSAQFEALLEAQRSQLDKSL